MARDPPLISDDYSPGILDAARTFQESSVTVSSGPEVTVGGGSLHLLNQANAEVSSGWTTNSSTDLARGIEVVADVGTTGDITLRAAPGVSGLTRVRVYDTTGSKIAEQTGLNVSAGGTVTLSGLSLTAGETYNFLADAGGGTWDTAKSNNTSDSDEGLRIVDMTTSTGDPTGTNYSSGAGAFDRIESTSAVTSGSATIEWPMPADVFGWDTALHTTDVTNGAVDVYVEENQAGSWVEVAGPIKRGDSIPADPSHNVRFRVEFSRPSTSDNPTLDSIIRRYTV